MAGGNRLFQDLHDDVAGVLAFPGAGRGGEGSVGPGTFSEALIARCLQQLLSKSRLKLFRRITHFVAAAQRLDIDVYRLAFGIPPSVACLRSVFEAAGLVTDTAVSSESVDVRYRDGTTFGTDFAGMPKLVCVLNILAHLLGTDTLEARVLEISTHSDDGAALDVAARDWATELDRFRQSNQGDGPDEQLFQAMVGFLESALPAGRFGSRDIDSAHVLRFWQRHADDPRVDVQRYHSAHTAFTDFVVELAARDHRAAAARARSLSVGPVDGGLADVDVFDAYVAETPPHGHWQALWDEHPSIKFLTGADRRLIAPIADLPDEATALLPSALRTICFSPVENRLIEHRRRNESAHATPVLLGELAEHGPQPGYADICCDLDEVFDKFADAVRATAHVLIANRVPEAIGLLLLVEETDGGLQRLPELAAEMGLAAPAGGLDEATVDALCHGIFAALEAQQPLPEALEAAIRRAHDCWRGTDRAGFRRRERFEPGVVADLDIASNRLPAALQHLCARLAQLRADLERAGGAARQQAADAQIIVETLFELYAGAPVQEAKHESAVE